MFNTNIKLSIQSLRSTKWRTFLTTTGIIVGVFSVVVTVSIGIGIRQQITGQIKELGPDLITILPGNNIGSNTSNILSRLELASTSGTGSFSERDLTLVSNTKGVKEAVPLASITGSVSINNQNYSNLQVIATSDGFSDAFNQTTQYGSFFNPDNDTTNAAIIGQNVATAYFKEYSPIGQTLKIRNQTFIVEGVLNNFSESPLTPVTNFNNAIFIPFSVGSQLSGGQPQIYGIYAKPYSINETNATASAISDTLRNERGGQTDFTVLDQKQNLQIATKTLEILTGLIAAVAAISILVGGVGIMNIMLVSVIERTKEIGIRKAIGATNTQVFSQFLIESSIIGLVGGIIGILLAYLADLIIAYASPIKPSVTLLLVALSLLFSVLAGLVFGAMPAFRAARKDPIDSLRHE